MRLVMGRHRPVHQAGGDEEPSEAVGMEDERVVAPQRVDALRVLLRLVVRALVGLAGVRVVAPGPLPLFLVPPDVPLALGPRPALGVSRGAVVEDSRVGGPGPAPLARHPVLLGPRLLARRLVGALLVNAGVDPRAARGRAVLLELLVLRDQLTLGVAAVDLPQHCLGIRLLV